jgi:hypothetical protein
MNHGPKNQKKKQFMMPKFRNPLLALGMTLYLSILFVSPAVAGMVGSVPSHGFTCLKDQKGDMNRIQALLESEIVKAKLAAYGLAPEEIAQKLGEMTEDQISLLARASEDLLAGGDGIGAVVGVLFIILLVLLILKVSNKTIIVK